MLCNHDNGKENIGGLKCESLCPEECKRQGCFDIINQNFSQVPRIAALAQCSTCKWTALGSWCSFPFPGTTRSWGEAEGPAVALGSWQKSGHPVRWAGSLGKVVGSRVSHGEIH